MNPFFEFQTHAAGTAATPPWHPLSELADPHHPALNTRVTAVRAYLATAANRPPDAIPLRAAASVTHLGLMARLLSPALLLTTSTGQVPDLTLAATWYQPATLASTFPLSLPTATHPAAGDLPEAFRRRILAEPIHQLVEATRRYSVSTRTLWGNVASALHAAGQLTPDAGALARRVLTHPPLDDAHTGIAGGEFRRRSCCLMYQISASTTPKSLCLDCILAPSGTHRD